MTYPPQPGQWNPSAPPPGPPQPPPGYYPPAGWNTHPPPQNQGGGLKWLLIGLAVLLVIAITVGATLFFTRDGSGPGGNTSTAATPSARDVASANDTGPVAVLVSDPTCEGWRTLQNTLAASQANGWADRDPSIPVADWTSNQRALYGSVGRALRTTADQAVSLAEQTPHRVMRELYEQFIAYGRAFERSLASYTAQDNFLALANVDLSSTISGVCDAIEFGGVSSKSSDLPPPKAPRASSKVVDVSSPSKFVSAPSSACSEWINNYATLQTDLRDWTTLDPNVSAAQWTPDQRRIQESATAVMGDYASKFQKLGQESQSGTFEDLAILTSQYFQAYIAASPTYTKDDNYLLTPGLRLNGAITAACQASVTG